MKRAQVSLKRPLYNSIGVATSETLQSISIASSIVGKPLASSYVFYNTTVASFWHESWHGTRPIKLAIMSSHGFFAATLATVLYLLLVRALRYQRSRHNAHAYPYATPLSLASMTNDDAQKIQAYILELEFPFIAGMFISAAFNPCSGI